MCYDHLAGDLGVEIYDALLLRKLIRAARADDVETVTLELTKKGRRFFDDYELDLDALKTSRRPLCRPCLDWSVRRYHLAGALGAALLRHCYERKWAKRVEGSRAVHFTPKGEGALRRMFMIEQPQ